MACRAERIYTDQEVLTLVKSFREEAFKEGSKEILQELRQLSVAAYEQFVDELMPNFSSIRNLMREPGSSADTHEGLIFVWPGGEVAFLSVPIICLESRWWPAPPLEGRVHRLLQHPDASTPGVPNELVVSLYRERSKADVSLNWMNWDGVSGGPLWKY